MPVAALNDVYVKGDKDTTVMTSTDLVNKIRYEEVASILGWCKKCESLHGIGSGNFLVPILKS